MAYGFTCLSACLTPSEFPGDSKTPPFSPMSLVWFSSLYFLSGYQSISFPLNQSEWQILTLYKSNIAQHYITCKIRYDTYINQNTFWYLHNIHLTIIKQHWYFSPYFYVIQCLISSLIKNHLFQFSHSSPTLQSYPAILSSLFQTYQWNAIHLQKNLLLEDVLVDRINQRTSVLTQTQNENFFFSLIEFPNSK